MVEIQEYMILTNEWWKSEYEIEFNYREILEKLLDYIPLRQIIALVGLRRVGKTTLMQKIIEIKINEEIDPQRILYFSFDEFASETILNIIKLYEDLHNLDVKKGNYLFFFDEIQKLKNWQNQIKTVYDQYSNIKLFISGSESLFLKKSIKENLAGRIFSFKIEPLNFQEFLYFKEFEVTNIKLQKRELLNLWDEFSICQGFPELVGIENHEIIHKYLKESLLEKILFKDIPQSYSIRDVNLLERILRTIYTNPGQIIEPSNLCNDLNTTRQTLVQYLNYLENSFIIKKIYNFSRDLRKIERKKKRYYPSIVSPELTFKNDKISKSIVFEWMVMKQLRADYFWRSSTQEEVDAILIDGEESKNQSITPIEIKYGKIKTKGLRKFMKQFNVSTGYIISKDFHDTDVLKEDKKTIFVVPAIEYFLKFVL